MMDYKHTKMQPIKRVTFQQQRKERVGSAAELARRSNLNAATISIIESGRLVPFDGQVEKMAGAMGTTPEQVENWLLADGEY